MTGEARGDGTEGGEERKGEGEKRGEEEGEGKLLRTGSVEKLKALQVVLADLKSGKI